LLIHDASLTADEVLAEASFGHAAAEYAAGLGYAAGASRVVLFHHKPDRTDEELDKIVSRLSDSPVPVIMAAEQETLVL
jgi:ribonuclease BN (tRNA processing enzyme)